MKKGKLYHAWLALTLCLALDLAGCGGGSQDEVSVTALKSEMRMAASVKITEGDLDPKENIHLVFTVKMNDYQGLEKYISEIFDPASSHYHKTLTSDEIRDRFGPTNEQMKKLTSYLRVKGFGNIKASENHLIVEADVTSQIAQSTFNTTLKRYILADGSYAHANKTAASIPREVYDVVTGVYGLDTVTRFQSHSMKLQSSSLLATATAPAGIVMGHNPLDYPKIYNAGGTSTASNMIIGIIAWGNPAISISDLHKFEQQNGLQATNTSIAVIGDPSVDISDIEEWSLDSQAIVAMAGGVKQLKFYTAHSSSFSDVLLAINAAIQDPNKPQVINMSFGICDTAGATSFDSSYFAVAIAQGQTFVASSGDYGSDCKMTNSNGQQILLANTTYYPASSPYVVSVGATTLGTAGATTYAGETAWSRSGGGSSQYVTIPFWQAIVPALAGSRYRSGPDVSFAGDPASGANIISNGAPLTIGGTSLSAPLFTAIWARMLQSCGTNLGFASPELYSFVNRNSSMLHDVASGTNGSYFAGPSWDKVTGWGSLNVDNVRAAMCPGAAYVAATEALYLAYLGRPADPAGLAFWSNQLRSSNAPTTIAGIFNAYGTNPGVTSIVNSLASSAESQSFYTTSNAIIFVTQIYSVLFNRAPDSAGLSYWVGKINNGSLSKQLAPLAILPNPATNYSADKVVAGNKFAVATNFTATLTTTQSAYYSGTTSLASARHLLKNVSSSGSDFVDFDLYYEQPLYVSRYQPSVNAAISAIVAGTPY